MGVIVVCIIDLEGYSNIRDPTYQEALHFVSSDQTEKHQYNQSYTCINFADDFVNNALKAGYRCGYVIIEFPEDSHAIICFNTSDNGLIFIEPQNDEMVVLATEQPYLGRTVLRFSITWREPVLSKFLSRLVLPLIALPLFMFVTLLTVIVRKKGSHTTQK